MLCLAKEMLLYEESSLSNTNLNKITYIDLF